MAQPLIPTGADGWSISAPGPASLTLLTLGCLTVGSLTLGCGQSNRAELVAPGSYAEPQTTTASSAEAADTSARSATRGDEGARRAATEGAPGTAALGRRAPAFSLPSVGGKQVSLEDYDGKIVVLEWFNPDCPFVKASHTKGSLVDAAARAEKRGVVWLAVNSGAAGKQGHGADRNKKAMVEYNLSHPVLLDESGQVGWLYGAERTPHLFVIDQQGQLAYRGAVDNSPDGEGESPEGGQLVRYVDSALDALLAGKPVPVAETKPYGCSVKYGD